MPQASEELVKRIQDHFRDPGVTDWEVSKYLITQGWVMDDKFVWYPPKDHKFSQKETDSIRYLIHEWDYGYEPGTAK